MYNIVEVATRAGQFDTLVAALKVAGLEDVLAGTDVFTVFAPTDAAFADLPRGALHALLQDTDRLVAVLTYHVVPGIVTAADLVSRGGARPITVNGLPVAINARDGQVHVNAARVIGPDVHASNGVIHVIDAVLLPTGVPAGAAS